MTPCPRCPNVVGPHLQQHMLRCKAVYTGGNNKRHNAVQQELLHWFREAGANVVCSIKCQGQYDPKQRLVR